MGNMAIEQYSDVSPPRAGQTLALTLDATARSYDISTLAMGGFTPDADVKRKSEVYLYMQTESAGAYFTFSIVAKTIDNSVAVAAGSALAYADTHCALIASGGIIRLRINRSLDKFLNVKGTGAGTLRLWISSNAG